jgi:hypothetical protein
MHILRTLDQLWPGALGNARPYQRTHPELPLAPSRRFLSPGTDPGAPPAPNLPQPLPPA